jgi:hypothetical protein
MCADPLGLRSLVHALAINNIKLQEMTLNVICEILRINQPRGGVDPFRQHPQAAYGDEGNKSMISDFDLVSRTRYREGVERRSQRHPEGKKRARYRNILLCGTRTDLLSFSQSDSPQSPKQLYRGAPSRTERVWPGRGKALFPF